MTGEMDVVARVFVPGEFVRFLGRRHHVSVSIPVEIHRLNFHGMGRGSIRLDHDRGQALSVRGPGFRGKRAVPRNHHQAAQNHRKNEREDAAGQRELSLRRNTHETILLRERCVPGSGRAFGSWTRDLSANRSREGTGGRKEASRSARPGGQSKTNRSYQTTPVEHRIEPGGPCGMSINPSNLSCRGFVTRRRLREVAARLPGRALRSRS